MFRFALLKLTLIYLSIIMFISLFFSLNIYFIAGQAMGKNFNRQQNALERRMIGPRNFLDDPTFLDEKNQLLTEAKQTLVSQLFYTNLVILALGGGLSYLLAKRTLKPIEEAHDSQVRFTADASHELRSPLAAMRTEIDVALRDPNLSKNEAIDLLKSNQEELGKLSALAEGLLELAKENGLEKTSFAVSEILSGAIEKVAKKAKVKSIIIKNSTDSKIMVIGDKKRLEEVFTILLDNAIKYSPEKTKIEIKGKTEGHFAEISVSDEGVGIELKDQKHIFERFWRADSSRSKNQIEGYGLGLSIAKKIIELHQGKIEVESIKGKGSTFIVMIPLART